MSNDKTVETDNIPIEVWKNLENRGIVWLAILFNEIMRQRKYHMNGEETFNFDM